MAKVHIIKSERWLGYAALVCAVAVFFLLRIIQPDGLRASVTDVILGPLGLGLALYGLFRGSSLPSRICAGIALVYFGWLGCSWVMPNHVLEPTATAPSVSTDK